MHLFFYSVEPITFCVKILIFWTAETTDIFDSNASTHIKKKARTKLPPHVNYWIFPNWMIWNQTYVAPFINLLIPPIYRLLWHFSFPIPSVLTSLTIRLQKAHWRYGNKLSWGICVAFNTCFSVDFFGSKFFFLLSKYSIFYNFPLSSPTVSDFKISLAMEYLCRYEMTCIRLATNFLNNSETSLM